MNKKMVMRSSLLVCATIIVAVGTMLAFAADPTKANAKGVEDNFLVTFDHSISIEDAMKNADDAQVRVTGLKSNFRMNGEVITDFYPVKSSTSSSRDIAQGIREGRKAIADTHNMQAKDLDELIIKDRKKTNLALPSAPSGDESSVLAQDIPVWEVSVYGEKQKATVLSDKLHGKMKERSRESRSNSSGVLQRVSRIMGVSVAYADATWDQIWYMLTHGGSISTGRVKDPERWVPEFGYTYVGQVDVSPSTLYGDRYAYNLMWWDNTDDFAYGDGYEHDFFLDNYDGATYMDSSQDAWGYPYFTYAATNLPYAYIDTRFSDGGVSGNIKEMAFTIGSSLGDAIQAQSADWYWTQVFTEPGNANTDDIKLQAQLVTEWPYIGCYVTYGTFCLFGDDSVPSKKLIPWGTYSAPTNGWESWSY